MRSDNKNQIPRTLLVGAFGPEVDRLVAGEAVPLGDQAAGVSRRRAFEVLEAGIGSVAAAVSVQARLLNPALPPITEILFLGSAGVYDAAVRGWGGGLVRLHGHFTRQGGERIDRSPAFTRMLVYLLPQVEQPLYA